MGISSPKIIGINGSIGATTQITGCSSQKERCCCGWGLFGDGSGSGSFLPPGFGFGSGAGSGISVPAQVDIRSQLRREFSQASIREIQEKMPDAGWDTARIGLSMLAAIPGVSPLLGLVGAIWSAVVGGWTETATA